MARPLCLAGTAAAVLGLAGAHARVHGYPFTGSSRFGWSLAYLAFLVVAGYAAGLPDLVRTRRSAAVAAVAATVVAALGISAAQLVVGAGLLPRFVVLGAPALLVPFAVLCSALAADGRAHDGRRDRVVVVAGLDEGFALEDELADRPERPAVVACVLAPDAAAGSEADRHPLIDVAAKADATAVVLDRRAASDDSIVAQAALLHEAGVRVRTLSLFYDEWLGKLPVAELERISLMFDIGELHRARYGRVRRIVDVLAAGLGLVALALLTPVVLVGNRWGNPGPLLFRQERVGKGGRRFTMLKFRTMRPGPAAGDAQAQHQDLDLYRELDLGTDLDLGAGLGLDTDLDLDEVDHTAWTALDDPRVTRFGGWLRRTHLDELPQVLNIARGELSVVGPRPEQPHYAENLEAKLPFYRLRHLVRPGLTGWAQVKRGYGATEEDALEKLQYEFYYLRHQSLALDLRIIGRTLRSVVGRAGR